METPRYLFGPNNLRAELRENGEGYNVRSGSGETHGVWAPQDLEIRGFKPVPGPGAAPGTTIDRLPAPPGGQGTSLERMLYSGYLRPDAAMAGQPPGATPDDLSAGFRAGGIGSARGLAGAQEDSPAPGERPGGINIRRLVCRDRDGNFTVRDFGDPLVKKLGATEREHSDAEDMAGRLNTRAKNQAEGRAASARNKRFRGMTPEARGVIDAAEGFNAQGRPLKDIEGESDDVRDERIAKAKAAAGDKAGAKDLRDGIKDRKNVAREDRELANKNRRLDEKLAAELQSHRDARADALAERLKKEGVHEDIIRRRTAAVRRAPVKASPKQPDGKSAPSDASDESDLVARSERSIVLNKQIVQLGKDPSVSKLFELFSRTPDPDTASALAKKFPSKFGLKALDNLLRRNRTVGNRDTIFGAVDSFLVDAARGVEHRWGGVGPTPQQQRSSNRKEIIAAQRALETALGIRGGQAGGVPSNWTGTAEEWYQ